MDAAVVRPLPQSNPVGRAMICQYSMRVRLAHFQECRVAEVNQILKYYVL